MAAKKSSTQTQVFTELPVTDHTANWTIKNFPIVFKAYKSGSTLKSPEFEIKFVSRDSKPMSTKWHFECFLSEIKYYPNNVCLQASLYLVLSENTLCPVGTRVAGEFSLLGTSQSWNNPYVDINSSRRLGQYVTFNDRDLRSNPDYCPIKDKLRIKCEMSFLLVGGFRLYACNSLTDFNPLRLELSDINAKARDRQAWEDLKNRNVVDLGPSLVTLAFGRDEEKVEEQCHTFPLAARSPVFRKMLTVDMLEKASGRVEMPHISPATGRQCSELFWFLITRRKRRYGIGLHPLYRNSK
jgi:hypothetical protein